MIKMRELSEKWWFWLIPLAIVLIIFFLYPVLQVINFSFTNAEIGKANYEYTINNYFSVFSDGELFRVIKITFIFVGGSVLFQLLLGLISGLLINKDLPGSSLVKLSMISAWVVPGVITGIIWQMLYSSSSWGIFNYFVDLIGLESIPFLHVPGWALFSVTLANIWRGTGFSGIMQYAALRGIPEQLYEAASIDGASKWEQFWHITLPQLRPMLLINVILITIYTFNTYDSVYALTKGGPGGSTTVISLQAYREVFRYLNMGKGSVYAVLMLALSITFTLIYVKLLSEGE